jgi:pyruvate dehydrogenase E2 component (dihydrolipoamide acetyltransferase)
VMSFTATALNIHPSAASAIDFAHPLCCRAMVDQSPTQARAAGIKGEVRIEEPDRAQRTIARRSAEARATVPDLELSAEVDMDASLNLRARVSCTVTALLLRACAAALREVPHANAAYRDGRFELYSRINIGIVIATGVTYTVPTVFDCDTKSLDALSQEATRLAERAASGELAAPDLTGATFTLSNPGALGVARTAPLIMPPQAAAVAAGAIRDMPVVRAGAIVPGHCMTITLACDHRILYGTQAALFLTRIKTHLEEATA